jgi:hypothetical protein
VSCQPVEVVPVGVGVGVGVGRREGVDEGIGAGTGICEMGGRVGEGDGTIVAARSIVSLSWVLATFFSHPGKARNEKMLPNQRGSKDNRARGESIK